jgi:hypothetical protein
MDDSGIAGLWLRLALVLVVAMLVGVGSVLLANRTLPKPVAEGHNSTLSPFLKLVTGGPNRRNITSWWQGCAKNS